MTEFTTDDLRATFAAMPKIELHRHLEGSIRLHTLVDIAERDDLDVPARTPDTLRPYVQMVDGAAHTAKNFLAKFDVLRKFYGSETIIRRIAREAVEDAAADNIRYMDLRFTPRALSRLKSFNFREVIRWVVESVREAERDSQIRVNLIVSVNRHESIIEARRILHAALDFQDQGVVAFDLAGKEAGLTNEPFYALFDEARSHGLNVTVHAGEWAGAHNIGDSIRVIGARRIGHGVRIAEDREVVELARQSGATFEVCLTSNVQSGVTTALADHPVRDMLTLGLNVTLNTDDPAICNVTLTDELCNAARLPGMTLDTIRNMMRHAAQVVFLPDDERAAFVADYTQSLFHTTKS